MQFDKQFLLKALPNAVILNDAFPAELNLSIDSRTLTQGQVFLALKGKRVDGHDFISQALDAGAVGLIIDRSRQDLLKKLTNVQIKKLLIIAVDDPFQSLIQLATCWRELFNCPVIGITGSVGKSTTKELVRNILTEAKIANCTSYGNQNSLIGASLNVLRMRSNHQAAVFEMGIQHAGEMAQLAEIVKPTIALITTIGHSHMSGLGSINNIAEEKRNIFKLFKAENVGIINGDQTLISQISYAHPVIKFGLRTTNQIQARKIQFQESTTHFTLKLYQNKYQNVRIFGSHNGAIYNALAACAVAVLLNIPAEAIVAGIQKPVSLPGRFEIKRLTLGLGGTLIDDCYNAGPESMKAALLRFGKMHGQNKVAVLSDMNELGVDTAFWHRQIGRTIANLSNLSELILIGNQIKEVAQKVSPEIKVTILANWQQAFELLVKRLEQESLTILLKGSTCGYTEGLKHLSSALIQGQANLELKQSQISVQGV